MAKHKRKSCFSTSELKARGWTNELIRTLLPKPRISYRNGARLWRRGDVVRCESNPLFIERRKPPASVAGSVEIKTSLSSAALWLKASADKAGWDDSPAGILSRRYHGAILYMADKAASLRTVRENQALGYINQFISLTRHCDPQSVPGILGKFVLSLSWIGSHGENRITKKLLEQYPLALYAAAQAVTEDFAAAQPEAGIIKFLTAENFPESQLLSQSLTSIYSVWYIPRAIRTSLSLLVALNPKDEYPEARSMKRHFVIHIGGTNTGKTYAGFQRLIRASTGVYLAPLRLLALEAQETMLNNGVNCSLSTGEEEDFRENDTHIAATAEKLSLKEKYEVAVIDECQMIADPQRGYAWTRAILGVLAPEIHLCAAAEAKNILIRLIESCDDTYEVQVHHRRTPLIPMNRPVDYTKIQPGDALITFSKIGVLSVAEDLRQEGKEPAIIYGALPYATRRMQMEGFLSGKMEYVVSTDAIGMGLNLPIRRIIFMETEKFDGIARRELRPQEVQQIAGRAGRYGMYDRGYVGATQNLGFIKNALSAVVPPIQHAVTGFSELVLEVDFDLLEVLTEWNKMPTVEPYVKLDITRYINIITKMRELGFHLEKSQELRAANIPFDETDESLLELFFHFLQLWADGEEPEIPQLGEGVSHTLPELELYYRKLDLFFSFTKAFDLSSDEETLYQYRENVASEINEILLHRLRNNIRFCSRCGKALPLHYHGRLCDSCYRQISRKRGYSPGSKRQQQ